MDVDIIAEEENPMLHRTDVTFELVHDEATPSRLQVRDSLAAKLNKGADEVVIRKLDTKFGMRKTVGQAKVYESANRARDVEQEYMLSRNKIDPDEDGADASAADAEGEADETDADTDESDAADETDAGDEEADADEADADETDEEE